MDGVGQAAVMGGLTAGVMEGAGSLLKGGASEIGEAAESKVADVGESCGLSFRADTPVATPNGEQKIGTLHVGEQVQSYDPTTKTVSTQVVQQVFINHDTDLIDVTLAVHPATKQTKSQQVAVISHGSHAPPATTTEVVHTTQKHPWLTTKGWITAGQLHLGDQVQRLDGTTATVVGLKIIDGTAFMYDLTVSNVHTFAVGTSQFVVHNCDGGVDEGEVDLYGRKAKEGGFGLRNREEAGDGLDLHHVPSKGVMKLLGVEEEDGVAVALKHDIHRLTFDYKGRAFKFINQVQQQLDAGISPSTIFKDQLTASLNDLAGLGVSEDVRSQIGAMWEYNRPRFFE
jgi:hypothetical protein